MKRRIFYRLPAYAVFFVMAVMVSFSNAGSDIVKKFTEALEAKDAARMDAVVAENKANIPSEVRSLIDEAMKPGVKEEDRTAHLYIAELLAARYKEQTNDFKPYIAVRTANVNLRLGPATRPKAVNGVHAIDMPKATDNAKNVFIPDNIVVKKGETVRWVNSDEHTHKIASMPAIGTPGIKTTAIEPGQVYDYKFEKPGDYYYICYIHQSMIGKITVEE